MKEVYIKNDNYLQISGWMINELNLKGNELMIYALIHGFSQDGKSDYHGGLQYIALWTNSTKQGVIKALKSLIEKGLIEKEIYLNNGVQYAKYWTSKSRANNKASQKTESGKQSLPDTQSTKFTTTQTESGKQSLPTQLTEFNGGSKLSLPNNININSLNSTSSKKKETEEDFITKELKKIFAGHYVFDSQFVNDIKVLAEQFEITDEKIPFYLNYVFKRARDKKPASLTNMYYKMAKSPNIMQDFILSEQPKELKEKEHFGICPVCGNKTSLYKTCTRCNFDMNDINNEKIISLKKQIYNLPEETRKQFEADYEAEINNQSKYSFVEKVSNRQLKAELDERIEMIYRKYGISA